ncbi:MAG TPA: hypothetical protein VIY49_34490 [Bryobacteraceae bacterium]
MALTALAGCKRARHDENALVPERNAPLASVVNVNDPATPAQLVRGFYAVEGGAWRWTAKDFEVALKPPPDAAEKGVRLVFRLNAPEAVISKFGAITLSASLNGLQLAPETYSKPGDYVYSRDIPATALKGDAVVAEFHSDKSMPPSVGDRRELALIAVSFGLESK